MLIKKRKAKRSKRGLYLQDRELNFEPGQHFKYVIDQVNRKVVILPTKELTSNTVSKRKYKDSFKPVIDIRSKQALSTFDECEYLQVEIFEDKVIVQGFVETDQNFEYVKATEDIQNLLQVEKVAEATFLKESFEQLDLFELLDQPKTKIPQEVQSDLHIPLQIASLFSGSGMLDNAMKEEGFDIVYALDKDVSAVESYKHNVGPHIQLGDINELDVHSIPKAPIMIGTPPCRGFSNANRISNFLHNPNNALVKRFIEAVKANENAKVFVMENVPGMLTSGDGVFKRVIERELSEFEITSGVLCSADFGDPQKRNRAIVIGSKIGKIELPTAQYTPDMYKTLRSAFYGLNDGVENQKDYSKPKEVTKARIESVPPGGNIHDIPKEIRPKGQHSDMYKRLEWDKPGVTIVNPRKAMLLHPDENRILSVRECARLFSLKDSFVFKGKLSEKQQQVADGVPQKLGQAIANVVKNAIASFIPKTVKKAFIS